MKLTKHLSFKQKVKYMAAKALAIVFTGRIDLRRDDDVAALLDAVAEKCERLGIHSHEFDEARAKAKELKKEWYEAVAPQRKTVTCKVYIDNGYYEQIKKYAAAKRYAEAVDDELYHPGIKGLKWGVRRFQNPDKDGRLSNMVDNLGARTEMLRQKICELEEDLEILKDLIDGDS
jgi:hypothetical protein